MIAASSALALAPSGHAGTVFSDDFTSEAPRFVADGPGFDANYTDFGQWTVLQGNVDLIEGAIVNGGSSLQSCGGDDYCVDLDGSADSGQNNPTSIIQTSLPLVLDPGTFYTAVLDISGDQLANVTADIEVSFIGLFGDTLSSETFTLMPTNADTPSFQTLSSVFGPTDVSLAFLRLTLLGTNDFSGPILRSVHIDSAPVPVPAALPLFAAAVGGFGLRRRLQKKS
ncbi:MAG: PEP-CTERM sorting domain-containing protein [Myxococcota bacterium]